MARFLRDELALALSPDKTLVTHARIRAARYLGYEITLQRADRKITRGCRAAWRLGALRWDAGTSMLKTPAAKHKSTVATIAAKHKAKVETPHGLRTCFEARIERDGKPDLVARFGGIPRVRKKNAVLHDTVSRPVPYPHKELIHRLLKRRCELCAEAGAVLVHQVRKLASLGEPGPAKPAWAAKMAQMRRKTLTVCRTCHDAIHGQPAHSTA